ncbi:MAG: zinc ribbon domain-containing protein [Vicinamibacteraceae bacterium]|nr:zinc ribbon domain-containing protein [Vicinamibacteraceae bacterium]
MPMFEYRCRACGREFEKLILSTRQAPDVACPGCESAEVERLLSTFGVGSGGGSSSRSAPIRFSGG